LHLFVTVFVILYVTMDHTVFKFFISYFVLRQRNARLFYKLSHSYFFRHYQDILRELVINILPSYTIISNVRTYVHKNYCKYRTNTTVASTYRLYIRPPHRLTS